jgi:hypothetical protein
MESNVNGQPPMRIYYRQSLEGDKPGPEMFRVTQAGVSFYEEILVKSFNSPNTIKCLFQNSNLVQWKTSGV